MLLLLLSSGLAFAQPDTNAPAPLSACDLNGDGTETFDLTTTIPQIMNGLSPSEYQLSFHMSLYDAEYNVSPISPTTAFTSSDATIFVRVHEIAYPSNYSVELLQLVVSPMATATVVANQSPACQGQPVSYTLQGYGGSLPYTFHYAINGNAMTAVASATSWVTLSLPSGSPDVFVIELQSVVSGNNCENNVTGTAIVEIIQGAVANQAPDIVHYEDPSDDYSTFDLTQNEPIITAGVPDLSVLYYQTQADAMAGVNPFAFPTTFNNTENPQLIWARAQNDVTGCFDITSFQVVVSDANVVYIPDAAFKAKLIADGADTNADGEIQFSEAEAVTVISIDDLGVADLTGIEAFANLVELYASDNDISYANLSGLAYVTKAYLNHNNIGSFNVSGMTALQDFQVGHNNLFTATISNLPNLEIFYASYNQQLANLNLSDLPSLKNLTVGEANLAYFDGTGFPALENLYLSGNSLTGFNVSGLSALRIFDFSWNQVQNIEFEGLSALEALYFDSNPVQAASWTGPSNIKWLKCNYTGFQPIEVLATTSLLVLECAGNGMTSLDLTQFPSLTNLICSNNLLTTLDTSSLSDLMFLECQNNDIAGVLDLNAATQLQFVSCYANNIEMLFVKNGADETIDTASFSENPLVYVCADESQVAQLQMEAGAGVQVNSYCSFTPGGQYNTIAGTVKFDAGGNGCDAGDTAQPLIKLVVTNGSETDFLFTNDTAQYAAFVGQGDYTVSPSLENNYFNVSPASAAVNFPAVDGSVSTNDFCLTPNGVHPDVEVAIMPIFPSRPGFDAVYKVVIRNKGNQVLSQPYGVTFFYDENLLDYVSSEPAAATVGSGSLSWNYSNLQPFENRSFNVVLNVNAPTDTPAVNIDDVLTFTANVMPSAADETPLDNLFIYDETVVGSFDPNDKKCLEGDVAPPALIGDYLHYAIQFENTGTAPAENIVVKDVIDATKFDVSTLQIMHSSHNVISKGDGNGTIFIFQSINLDSGGHGNILLKVKTLGTLVEGDTVSNKADIYFDYNFPIITEPANTLFQLLSVDDPKWDASVQVFPNPARDIFNVKASSNITSVQLYDVQGRLLQVKTANEPELTFDISAAQTGTYFVRISTENGIRTEKIVKQ